MSIVRSLIFMSLINIRIPEFTFRFPKTWGYGVRMFGTPAGPAHFTSISRLAAYSRGEAGQ